MKKQKRFVTILAALLVVILAVGVLAACNPDKNKDKEKKYTVLDAFVTSPSTWNPHTYHTEDDSYPLDYTYSSLYEFYFNSDKTGYEIWPVMAASEPVDVTTTLKSEAKWKIPEDATKGYAYTIDLNQNAKWDDGTVINADTYVESMKLLLDPDYVNYRASNYYTGSLQIFGAKDYNKQNAPITNTLLDESGGAYTDALVTAKNADGEYTVTIDDKTYPIVLSLDEIVPFFGDGSLNEYYDAYKGEGYFDDVDEDTGEVTHDYYAPIKAKANKYNMVPVTDDVIAALTTISQHFGDPNPVAWNEYCFVITGYGSAYNWDNVGIYKSGEYQITLVFDKSLSGFYLLYNLNSPWIVNVDKYKAGLSQDQFGIWNNTYNTNVQAGTSCGPYKFTTYQEGKLMVFDRNENWFGYSDPRFKGMYQATGIRATNVPEAATRKQMFLKGELDTYGLQAEDYADYRTSDYFYQSPGTTIFFLVLSSNPMALKTAETNGVDKEIIANDKFREALSLAFNKSEFAASISPSRSGAYSVIGAYDIWNPSTGEKYRDTEIAKRALAEYYGFTEVGNNQWKSAGDAETIYTLDEAVDAITGYDVAAAKVLMQQAYDEQIAAGKMSATDKVEIEFALSSQSSFIDKTIDYLNEQIAAVTKGTSLEGKVSIVQSAPQGNAWSTALRQGKSQTQLCGWQGGMLDPFGSMLYYTYPEYEPYASEWWDTTTVEATMTLNLDGTPTTLTMTLEKWALCLNGDVVNVDGNNYNFGYEQVADEVRLQILANLEKEILSTNYYIPMLQDGSGFLLTKKVNYALGPDDYNAVLARGGIAYMTFNYSDAEWEAYCKSQGQLTY